MKVLISAYACRPERGSEGAVGWRWTLGLSQKHEVHVITAAQNRARLQAAKMEGDAAGVAFHYVEETRAIRWISKIPLGIGWLAYFIWQWKAGLLARQLHRQHHYDICHQLTFCTWRAPSFLWMLGIPFIWGPIGGGGDVPRSFFSTLGFRGTIYESWRRWCQSASQWDPLLRATMRRACAIICANEVTRRRIPAKYHYKCRVIWEMGVDAQTQERHTDDVEYRAGRNSLSVVWVGRVVPLKGLPLLLGAMSRLGAAAGVEVTVVGDGPDRARCEHLVTESGLTRQIRFTGWVPHSDVHTYLRSADVLVFTSLRETHGIVQLEALETGTPVVSLDIPGPGDVVNTTAGESVSAISPRQVEEDLAVVLDRLGRNPERRKALAAMAWTHARRKVSWEILLSEMNAAYELAWSAQNA